MLEIITYSAAATISIHAWFQRCSFGLEMCKSSEGAGCQMLVDVEENGRPLVLSTSGYLMVQNITRKYFSMSDKSMFESGNDTGKYSSTRPSQSLKQ